MKHIFLSLGLALALSIPAQAKTPKEVLTPYKAYQTALAADDHKLAAKKAYEAWQKAEELIGESQITGDLAANYAALQIEDGKTKRQIEAIERAMALSSFYKEGAHDRYLERGVLLLEFHGSNGDLNKVRKNAKDLVLYAEENGKANSVFYAEVLTQYAGSYVKLRRGKRMVELAQQANDAFKNPDEIYPSAYPILAHLYQGFGHEYEGEVLEAALSYQKVMEYVGELDHSEHPLVGRALGRWIHMRGRLRKSKELKDAMAKGLCQCWPYDVERNETVKPLKRVPPQFPSKAARVGVSGYTVVEFDLDDEGNTINHKVITSWPPDLYEEAALKSLRKWEYSPRLEGESDADRSNLISTIRFDLSDRFGNPVY